MDWKKEYKLSDLMRRSEGEAPAERPEAPGTQAPGDSTMWKKEIRIGGLFRRRKPAKQRALPQIGDTVREGAAQPAAAAAPAPDASIWKKELKLSSLFRRRKATPSRRQLALPAPGGTVVDAPTPEASRAAAAPPPQPETVVEETPAAPTVAEPPAAPTVAEAPAAEPTVEQATPPAPPAAPEPAQPASATPAAPLAEAPAPAEPKERLWKREIGRKRKPEDSQDQPTRGKRPERREREEPPKQDRQARAESRGSKGGGALPQVPLMKAVNLLPQDIKLPKTTLRPWVAQVAVGVVGVLVVGGMAFLFLNERNRIDERTSALEDAHAELAAIEAQAQQPVVTDQSGPALEGEALTRATALSGTLDGRRGWDRLLRELSLTLPDNVWFESMMTTLPTTPAPTDPAAATPVAPVQTPATVTITGYALAQPDVAQFLARLEVVPEFSSIQLESAAEESTTSLIKFTIHGALKSPTQVIP